MERNRSWVEEMAACASVVEGLSIGAAAGKTAVPFC